MMRVRLALLAPAALAIVLPALAPRVQAAERTIEPGYWETTDQVVSPLPQSKTQKLCIKPEDVEKFLQGPSNHIYACTYPTREFHGGKIRLEGTCASKHSAPMPVTGEGAYSASDYRIDAEVSAKMGALSLPVHFRSTGHRLGDECPTQPSPADK
jgi:hypothetical protein